MTAGENPYASPEAQPDPASRLALVRFAPLPLAGFIIFLMGLIQTIIAAVSAPVFVYLYFIVANSLPYYSQQEGKIALKILSIVAALTLLRGPFLILGGASLRSGRRFRISMAGALVAIIGFVLPCFWLEVPFGLWAMMHLRKVARVAFAEAK